MNYLKIGLKKFPFLWFVATRCKDTLLNLSRLKDVMMMMILLHIWPEMTYKFSTKKFLPSKKNRFCKKKKPTIPFELLKSKSNNIPIMNEINIIGRGSSFNYNNLKKIKGPTFLGSFWVPLKMDNNGNIIYTYETLGSKNFAKTLSQENHNYDIKNAYKLKEFKKKIFVYVISRVKPIRKFKKNEEKILSVLVYVKNKNGTYKALDERQEKKKYQNLFKDKKCQRISVGDKAYLSPMPDNYSKFAPTGSFLPTICALSYFAKKINIYGWDFYLPSSPKNMNYWKLFFNMYYYDADVNRSKNHFESALINFYYGYHLSRLPNFKIHGYMGKLAKHKKLINRIEKVLFN